MLVLVVGLARRGHARRPALMPRVESVGEGRLDAPSMRRPALCCFCVECSSGCPRAVHRVHPGHDRFELLHPHGRAGETQTVHVIVFVVSARDCAHARAVIDATFGVFGVSLESPSRPDLDANLSLSTTSSLMISTSNGRGTMHVSPCPPCRRRRPPYRRAAPNAHGSDLFGARGRCLRRTGSSIVAGGCEGHVPHVGQVIVTEI